MLRPSSTSPAANLRDAKQVAGLRQAATVVAESLRAGRDAAVPGMTTAELSRIVGDCARRHGASSLFPGYRQGGSPPFPADACICVNEEVVHGVPGARHIHAGDLVTIDYGVRLHDWCGDSATSFIVPGDAADPAAVERRERLIEATKDVLALAIESAEPGVAWSDVARILEQRTADHVCDLVHEYVGHGIGHALHEPPKVPAYWTGFTGTDFVLRPGMVLAIEPILTLRDNYDGNDEQGGMPRPCSVRIRGDGWTVATMSHVEACHEEAMGVITDDGAERLTPFV